MWHVTHNTKAKTNSIRSTAFPSLAKDACYKAAEVGNCQNYEARWYFDTKESRCRQFYYGGCGGNENNFIDEHACLSRCEKIDEEPEPPAPAQRPEPTPSYTSAPQPESEPFRTQHCFLPSEVGDCRALVRRYFYNSQEGLCELFGYGGCGGNQNNFVSIEECEQHCGNAQNPCSLPPVAGRCQENITRFYYDHRSGQCAEFEYTGCHGNRNNFYTESECRAQCQPDRATEKPIIDVVSVLECVCVCVCVKKRRKTKNEFKIDFCYFQRFDECQALIDECESLRCPYGISKTYDANRCERCECENPCREYVCSEDSKCAVDVVADPTIGSTFAAVCRKGKCSIVLYFPEFG